MSAGAFSYGVKHTIQYYIPYVDEGQRVYKEVPSIHIFQELFQSMEFVFKSFVGYTRWVQINVIFVAVAKKLAERKFGVNMSNKDVYYL